MKILRSIVVVISEVLVDIWRASFPANYGFIVTGIAFGLYWYAVKETPEWKKSNQAPWEQPFPWELNQQKLEGGGK